MQFFRGPLGHEHAPGVRLVVLRPIYEVIRLAGVAEQRHLAPSGALAIRHAIGREYVAQEIAEGRRECSRAVVLTRRRTRDRRFFAHVDGVPAPPGFCQARQGAQLIMRAQLVFALFAYRRRRDGFHLPATWAGLGGELATHLEFLRRRSALFIVRRIMPDIQLKVDLMFL
ncbi:hypothetical protein D3C86_1735200 [compost metagenome]